MCLETSLELLIASYKLVQITICSKKTLILCLRIFRQTTLCFWLKFSLGISLVLSQTVPLKDFWKLLCNPYTNSDNETSKQ